MKTYQLKRYLFFTVFLFLNQLIYSQNTLNNMSKIQEIKDLDFGLVTIKSHETITLNDGLTIYWQGAILSNATTLTLTRCGVFGELTLLLSNNSSSLYWKGYKIQLKNYSPSSAILNITVSKKIENGNIISIHKDEEVQVNKSLSVRLDHFSHKRPRTGGPTKMTASLTLIQGNRSKEIALSAHGIQGNLAPERFNLLCLDEYEIQLKSYVYDKSVEIFIVEKVNNKVILLREEVQFESLTIRLAGFSGKNGVVGSDNYKSTAKVTLSNGSSSKKISLSMYGNYNSSIMTFDNPINWKGYKIQLVDLAFGESIGVIVSKIK